MSARLGVEVCSVNTPEEAARAADIIVVATNTARAPDPIAYRGSWMTPGVHVNSIGSTMPTLFEIDPETFRRADLIAVDSREQLAEESGDAIAAAADGAYAHDCGVELKDIVAGKAEGRTSDTSITLFKSVGTAVQDVMAAYSVYETATEAGIGQVIDDFLDLKEF